MILHYWEDGDTINCDREDTVEVYGREDFILDALNLVGATTAMWKCLRVLGNGAQNPGEVKARDTDLVA